MNKTVQSNNAYARLTADLDLLHRRGIAPGDNGYTARQLARELARRGWRWNLDTDGASATKGFSPTGTGSTTVFQLGPEQTKNLIVVLAHAIRFDEEHGLTLVGPYRADIVVRAPDGRIVAIAEINNRIDLNSNVAVDFRRDLIADNQLDPWIPFLLVISQDVGFLWDRGASGQPFVNPSASFPTSSILEHYLPWYDPAKRLSNEEVQHTVARWLRDIASNESGRPTDVDASLMKTTFLEAMHGASVSTDDRE